MSSQSNNLKRSLPFYHQDDDNEQRKRYHREDHPEYNAFPAKSSVHSDEDYQRSVIVGNLHQDCTADLLSTFLHDIMSAAGILHQTRPSRYHEGPIEFTDVYDNGRSVIQFRDHKDATAAIRLHNIPFMGRQLHIERHMKWTGPGYYRKSRYDWSHFLNRIDLVKKDNCDPGPFLHRNVVVKNFSPEGHQLLPLFVASAMEQLGLVREGENPIKDFRLNQKSGRIAFLYFQTASDARNAFLLQELPFLGSVLRFERPFGYEGDPSLDKKQDWKKSIYDFFHGLKENTAKELSDMKSFPKDEAQENHREFKCKVKLDESVRHESTERGDYIKTLDDEKSERLLYLENMVKMRDNEIKSLQNDVDERRSEVCRLQQAEVSYKATISSLKKGIGVSNKSCTGALSKLSQLQKEVEETKAQHNDEKSDRLVSLENAVKMKDTKITALQKDIEDQRSEICRLQNTEVSQKAVIKSFQGKMEEIKNHHADALTKLSQSQIEVEKVKAQQSSYGSGSRRLDFLQVEIEAKNDELKEKSQRIKELEQKNEKHTDRIMTLMDKLFSQDDRIRTLENDLQSTTKHTMAQNLDYRIEAEGTCNENTDTVSDTYVKIKEEHHH